MQRLFLFLLLASLLESQAKKTYDEFGCCISCGHYYCSSKGKCVEEWKYCDAGVGKVGSCSYKWAGLSWSLSALKKKNPYIIQDSFSNPTQNWTYVLGICNDVPPSTYTDQCQSTTGSAGEVMTDSSPAFQILDTTWDYHSCYRLGDSISDTNVEWGVYDPLNPAQGFYIRYTGGNACKDTVSDKAACDDDINGVTYCRRSLKLNFLCNNEVKDIPTFEEVEEARGCEYEASFNSVYGCPKECPKHNGMVCNARGLCFYDGFEDGYTADGRKGTSQCLCEAPFSGDDCSSIDSGIDTSNWMFWLGILLICVGIGLMVGAKKHELTVVLSGWYNLAMSTVKGNQPTHDYTKVSYQDDEPGVAMEPNNIDHSNTFSL